MTMARTNDMPTVLSAPIVRKLSARDPDWFFGDGGSVMGYRSPSAGAAPSVEADACAISNSSRGYRPSAIVPAAVMISTAVSAGERRRAGLSPSGSGDH